MRIELQRLFDLAIRAYILPLDESNGVPVIGIAFANWEIPKRLKKIMDTDFQKYNIDICSNDVILHLKISTAVSSEYLFDVKLNYEERKYNLFKKQVNNGSKGAFVLGVVHNGNYTIVADNVSTFTPFQVHSFMFV